MSDNEQNYTLKNLSDECIIVLTDEERDVVKRTVDNLPPLDIRHMDDDCFFLQVELAKRALSLHFLGRTC